jgi:hypothetical protein
MRIRNALIMVLLALAVSLPLVAFGTREDTDPQPQQDQPQQDQPAEPAPQEPAPATEEEDQWDAEEEDEWDAEEEDEWATEEEEPLDPADDDPAVDVEDDDPADVDTQAEPGDAEDETALNVISEHQRTSIAYDLFGEEFAEALDGGEQLAIFVPVDDALDGMDRENLSDEEIRSLYERHVATGLASEEPIEFIESFATLDGQMITVTVEDDGTVMLNGTARVIEVIPVTNGIVYIIDGTFGW